MNIQRKNKLLFFVFLFLTLGCSSGPKTSSAKPSPTSSQELGQREGKISDIKYDIQLLIPEKGENFEAVLNLQFKSVKTHTYLDFVGGEIHELTLNGIKTNIEYDGKHIFLSQNLLKDTSNIIKIKYSASFSKSKIGLIRVHDEIDGKNYIYSNLEPFGARLVFPSFDQPNLKAIFKTTVVAPKKWTVISNTKGSSQEQNDNLTQTWVFNPNFKMSTYLWAVHAGPFFKASKSIFLRKSQKAKFKNLEIENKIHKAMQFYQTYFASPFPFEKLEFVFLPQLGFSAMENIGAVTVNERFLKKPVEMERVFLHEIAHAWIGNLLSVKDWKDVWMTESLTEFLALLAFKNQDKTRKIWREFQISQLALLNPSVTPASETSIFDSKQIAKGLSNFYSSYFQTGPQEFKQKIRALIQNRSAQGISEKEMPWLGSTETTQLQASFKCESGKLEELNISLGPKDAISSQKIEIAVVGSNSKYGVDHVFTVELDSPSTEVELPKIVNCPKFVYPNHKRKSLSRVQFDDSSLEFLVDHLHKIKNVYLRQLIWTDLWSMVLNAKFSISRFSRVLLIDGFQKESDPYLLKTFAHFFENGRFSLLYLFPKETEGEQVRYNRFLVSLEDYLWSRLKRSKSDQQQNILFDLYLKVARSFQAQNHLIDIINSRIRFRFAVVTQERRWKIIHQLSKFNYPGVEQFLTNEEKKDKSVLGQLRANQIHASLPDWDFKRKWIDEIKNTQSTYLSSELNIITDSIFPLNQDSFRNEFSKEFFSEILKLPKDRAKSFAKLSPFHCAASGSEELSKQLDGDLNKLESSLKAQLQSQISDSLNCSQIKDFSRVRLP